MVTVSDFRIASGAVDDPAQEPYWGEKMWQTRIFLKNDLKGPITYEVQVPGADDQDEQPLPVSLEAASTYTVVALVIANDVGPRLISGWETFVP